MELLYVGGVVLQVVGRWLCGSVVTQPFDQILCAVVAESGDEYFLNFPLFVSFNCDQWRGRHYLARHGIH